MESVQSHQKQASMNQVSLLPKQSVEFLFDHEIKELGIHILVCTVSYTLGEERKFQRKFYKFQVLNPLSLKLSTVKICYQNLKKRLFDVI